MAWAAGPYGEVAPPGAAPPAVWALASPEGELSADSGGLVLINRGGFSVRAAVRLDGYISLRSSSRFTAAVLQFRICSTPNRPSMASCSCTEVSGTEMDSPTASGRWASEISWN